MHRSFIEAVVKYAKMDNPSEPRYHIHFSKINKLGVNPIPDDPETPLGIYAFPLGCYKDLLKAGVFPPEMKAFLKESYHAFILEPLPDARILYMTKRYPELVAKYWKRLKEEDRKRILLSRGVRSFSNLAPTGDVLYEIALNMASDLTIDPIRLTRILKKEMKFDVIIDNKGYVIHEAEAYQTIFLPHPFKFSIVEEIEPRKRSLSFGFRYTQMTPEEITYKFFSDFLKNNLLNPGSFEYFARLLKEFHEKTKRKITKNDILNFHRIFKKRFEGKPAFVEFYRTFPELLPPEFKSGRRYTIFPVKPEKMPVVVNEILENPSPHRDVERFLLGSLVKMLASGEYDFMFKDRKTIERIARAVSKIAPEIMNRDFYIEFVKKTEED